MNTTTATVQVTEDNFEETVQKGIVLLDWWAPWCGPCRVFGPVFEAAAKKNPDIVFGKINTQDQPGLGAAFKVRAIPTLMILRDGVLLFSQAGALPAPALDDLIAQVRALDMDKIRKEIEAQNEAKGKSAAPAAQEVV